MIPFFFFFLIKQSVSRFSSSKNFPDSIGTIID